MYNSKKEIIVGVSFLPGHVTPQLVPQGLLELPQYELKPWFEALSISIKTKRIIKASNL